MANRLTSESLGDWGLRIIEIRRSQQTTFAAVVSKPSGSEPISSEISWAGISWAMSLSRVAKFSEHKLDSAKNISSWCLKA